MQKNIYNIIMMKKHGSNRKYQVIAIYSIIIMNHRKEA